MNLKQVSDFAVASSKGQLITGGCLTASAKLLCKLQENDTKTLRLNADTCDCTLAVKAGSVDNVLYSVLQTKEQLPALLKNLPVRPT